MPARDPAAVSAAYVEGLKLLARRELSEAEVRQRLQRRGHDAHAIDAAVARLLAEHAIDDERTAEAIARREATVGRHGRLRTERRIAQRGIAEATARRVVTALYAEIDPDALMASSLARRLGGRDVISGQREFGRLYRYLIGQGFEADRIIKVLKERSVK